MPATARLETDPLSIHQRVEGIWAVIDESHATDAEKIAIKKSMTRLLCAVNDLLETAMRRRK